MKYLNIDSFLAKLREFFRTEKNLESQFTTDLITSFSLFGLPLVIFLLITQATRHEGFVYIFISLIAMASANLILMKYSEVKTKTLGKFSCLTLFFSMLGFCFLQQTFFHGSFYWFVPSIIINLIFLRLRYSILILSIYIYVIIHSHILYRPRGFVVTSGWTEGDFMNNLMINQLAATLFSFVLLLLFFKNRDRSIKELENAHKQIIAQQQSMFHSSKLAELGEVAGGIAHEINNPLQVIAGNVQILQKENEKRSYDETKYAKHLAKISDTVLRISKIINTMRGYSRDGSQDNSEFIKVTSITTELSDFFMEKLKTKQIKLEIIGDLELQVFTKRVQLFQILLNLINNAIDALDEVEMKLIVIDLSQDKNWKYISVIDSGYGISKEIEDKIFQPFFTTKPFGKGTGLGLSISYKIMREHKGELYVDRTRGDSRMTIKFPNT